MSELSLDRNLLFGVLAVQMRLVSGEALMSALRAWVVDGYTSLDRILVERGTLAEEDRILLEPLVGKQLEQQRDDAERSLAQLSSDSWIKPESPPIADRGEQTPYQIDVGVDQGRRKSFVDRRYQILRPHAKGGLGEVSLALDRELGREVAIKQMQPQFADDPLSRARFLREAEVTGGLEHPGIVPVYALGADAGGNLYYAMRFIRGHSLKDAIARHRTHGPIARAWDEKSLDLRKLLGQFVDVCNTIEYAHSRGVLHRDIKPSNIIVGAHGETLVVDWGLAKATGRATGPDDGEKEEPLLLSTSSKAAETMPGLAMGTPSFMSPEQAGGAIDLIGPASDVYSLGATLYYLLTGQAPFQQTEIFEVLRAVKSGEFPHPRELDPSIPPALDAVCKKAMELEPSKRYPSPRALADDFERWMADEPVSVRPEPFLERASRWMRRRRTAVAAVVAAMIVALLGSGGILAVQAHANQELKDANIREQARFDLAMEAIRAFQSTVSQDLLLKEPQFGALRARLLGGARDYSFKLEALLKNQTDRRARSVLGQAYHELAELTDKIGSKPDALELCRHALALRRELARGAHANSDAVSDVASCLLAMGRLHFETGQTDGALVAYQEAKDALEAVGNSGGRPQGRALRATCYHLIGDLLAATGRPDEAMRSYLNGRSLREAMNRENPSALDIRGSLAESEYAIGILHWSRGRQAEAVASFQESQVLFEALLGQRPEDPELRRRLAAGYNAIGYPLHAIGRTDEALRSFEAARTLLEALVKEHPAITEFRRQLAYSGSQIGTLLADSGRASEALRPYEDARDLLETLAQANPSVAEIRNDLARCYSQLGHALMAIGKPVQALASCENARALRETLVAANPSLSGYQSDLAATLGTIAALRQDAGEYNLADEALRRAIKLLNALARPGPDDFYNLACYHARLASIGSESRSGTPSAEIRLEADCAMNSLRRAVAAGFRILSLIGNDHDLDSLRRRGDFQLLMMDLRFPHDPFGP
jgi:serine/threonine-protein kinase